MYGDGSSPYSGLGRDLHRIAPSVHEFVQRSTTAMWGAKHDTWNPRGVLQEAMEADGKQVKGGLHKFDASEVDAYGGEGTADDLMDAFGF